MTNVSNQHKQYINRFIMPRLLIHDSGFFNDAPSDEYMTVNINKHGLIVFFSCCMSVTRK